MTRGYERAKGHCISSVLFFVRDDVHLRDYPNPALPAAALASSCAFLNSSVSSFGSIPFILLKSVDGWCCAYGKRISVVGLCVFAAMFCVCASTEKTRPGHLVTCGIRSPSLRSWRSSPGLGSAAKWGGHTSGTKAQLIKGDRVFLF